jgi:hypothetical protein
LNQFSQKKRLLFACLVLKKEGCILIIIFLEDLKAAQKDLIEAKDLDELKKVFKKWCRIGWKNICNLWLQERAQEPLEGEGG